MAKKKGPTEDEGILELGFEYDATGEQAAVKGAENVGTAIEKTGKKAKKVGDTDLKVLETSLLKVGTASNSVTNEQNKVSDALSSTVTKLQAQNATLRETVAQFNKLSKISYGDKINEKMAGASGLGLKVDKFAASPAVQSGMDYKKHLTNVESVSSAIDKYTKKIITSTEAVEKKAAAEVKVISKMKSTEQQLAAVVRLEGSLASSVSSTSKTLASTSIVTANFSKNLEGLVKVTKDDDEAIKDLKKNTAKAYNNFEASNRVLQEHKLILQDLKEKTTAYRVELQAKQKLEKDVAKLTDEKQRLALLDAQNQRLAVAKAEFDAMSTAAEKYKNTLEAVTRVGAKGYVPVATNVPYTPTGAELTSKLTDMGGNYAELKKVTDARQQSTAALIAEAKEHMNSASKTKDYAEKLKFTEMATEKLKEASLANKSALFDIGTLANQTGANLKTYTKYIQDNDTATLALKNGVVDLSNQLIDSRDGLRAQSKGIMENITNLNTERKSIIANIKAQEELEKARLRTQASQNAVAQLGVVETSVPGVVSTLGNRKGLNASALADAQALVAAADKAEEYKDKLENLSSAYRLVNSASKENNMAMASAKLAMEPMLALYKKFGGDLDETDPKAKKLKGTLEKMIASYNESVAVLKKQGISFDASKADIKEQIDSWKRLSETTRKANLKLKNDIADGERIFKSATSRVAQNMHEMSMLTKQWGVTFARYFTAPIIAAGFQAVKFTAEMEMNIKSLEILLGNDAKAAEELYTKVTQYAAKTPYEIPDLTAATKQLLAFGSASGDVMDELRMLGDLAQNDAEKLESVTSAFGKVQARGVAHMRELNRFIMAGVPIIQTLGKVMEKDSESLFKAVEQGQVSFAAIKQSIQLLTSEGERFYNMSEKLAKTVKGRWSTLSDEVNLALKSFADDYMGSILKAIEKVIGFAEALQTLSKEQRQIIVGWVTLAASIAPVLFITSKVAATARLIYKHVSASVLAHRALLVLTKAMEASLSRQAKLITGGIVAAVITVAAIIGTIIYQKVKKTTEDFKEQKTAIEAAVNALSGFEKTGGYIEKVREQAVELNKTIAPSVKVETIMEILKNQTADTAPKVLTELENFMKAYNAKMNKLLIKRELINNILDNNSPTMLGKAQYRKLEADAAYIEDTINKMEAMLKDAESEAAKPETYLDFLKKRLGVTGSAADDIVTVLQTFKYNTEEAINGTLAQFSRFAGVVPIASELTNGLTAIRVAVDNNKATSFTAEDFKEMGIVEGSAAYNLLQYLMTPKEGMTKALAAFEIAVPKLIEYASKAATDYIDATASSFRSENLADILLGGDIEDNPALKQKYSGVIAKAYIDVINEAIKQAMAADLSLDYMKALDKVRGENATWFKDLEGYQADENTLKSYEELTKIIDEYNTKASEMNFTDVEKFDAQIDAMLDKLIGTSYWGMVKDDIPKIKQAFRTLEFDKVTDSLLAQKNALVMTADALKQLEYAHSDFSPVQVTTLNRLSAFNDALKTLKDLAGGTPTIFGANSEELFSALRYNPDTSNPASLLDTLHAATNRKVLAEESALSRERSSAIKALAKAYVEADDATRRLTESSEDYMTLMTLVSKTEWGTATATEYAVKANEQLIANQIAIAEHGKDANEIQIAFWEAIKSSGKLTVGQVATIDLLIKSYEKLIDLGKDEAAAKVLPDALKAIREEIDAFSRTPFESMQFELASKKMELFQSAAEDTGLSVETLQSVFTGELTGAGTTVDTVIAQMRLTLEDFDTYLKTKAFQGLKEKAAQYTDDVAKLGMSERDALAYDLNKDLADTGLKEGVYGYAEAFAYLNSVLASFDTIQARKELDSFNSSIEKYQTMINELGMNDEQKAIASILSDNPSADANQIKELTYWVTQYYAAVKRGKDADDKAQTSDSFSDLLKGLRDTAATAGMDEWNKFLYTNAELIKKQSEATGISTDTLKWHLKTVYDATDAVIKQTDAQKQLNDITADYEKQVRQLNMSDRDKFEETLRELYKLAEFEVDEGIIAKIMGDYDKVEADKVLKDINASIDDYQKKINQIGMSDRGIAILDTLETNKGATPEKLKELISLINQYYDAIETGERKTKKQESKDTYTSLIEGLKDEAASVSASPWQKFVLDNSKAIWDWAIASGNASKAFEDLKKQFDDTQAIKESANNTMKLVEALQALSDMQKEVSETQYKPLSEVFGDLSAVTGATKFGAGNIDLQNRPVVDIGNGAVATINSFSKQFDNFEVLIPQVVDGMLLSVEDAIAHYLVSGEYLKKIGISNMSEGEIEKAREELSAYGEMLHKYEEYRLDFDNISGLIDATVGESLAKSINERTEVDKQYLAGYKQYTDTLSLIDEEVKNGLPKDEEFVKRMQALSMLVSILEQVEYSAKKVAEIKWTDLKGEIGTVGGVFFRNPRQDMYDNIEKTGLAAGISTAEIDAQKKLYDDVENAKILKGVLDSIANTAFDALITDLERVGEAMSEGATWGEAFEDTIGNIVGALINALPQLLMSAGLQLITAGQWHIGLPLIAAAGAAAILKGYVKGETSGNKDGTTTPSNLNLSAKGDSFDRGRILNVPTVFNTASGLNIGGELGTEAILPLSRDSNGRLGVNVAGSGGGNTIAVPVTVNIVNQSGVETEAEVNETTNADGGKTIEVIIKKIVNKGMANGEYDRTMKSRYGLSNRGVS